MENIRIAIVTGEREYGRALSMSLLNVCRDFVIKIYDSRQFIKETSGSLSKEMQQSFCGKFDLILWDGEEIRQSYGGNIVYLAEKASLTIRDYTQKKFCLYKYSTAQTMVASVFEIYSFLTGRTAPASNHNGVRLFAFASWAGGTGCSTMTMAVGQELCRFQKMRVMYLSFEDVESTLDFIEGAEGVRDAGEYLYRLFRDREQALSGTKQSPFLDGHVIRDPYGLEAFMPTKGQNPLRTLTGGELQIFVESIMSSGRYDMILMDMGSCLNEAAITALQMAEKICITCTDASENPREEAYYRQLIYRCDEKVLEKCFKLVNKTTHAKALPPHPEQGRLVEDDSILPARITVPFSEDSVSRKGRKGIVLENDFGERIVELAKMLVNPDPVMV